MGKRIIFKCMNKYALDLYPVYKKAFYFQRHYKPTIKEYHDISITHTGGQRFTHFGTISLHKSIQKSKPLLVWADSVKLEYSSKIQSQDQPEFFRNYQSFTYCLTKMLIGYIFFIDLDSIHNKSSCDYSLIMFLAPFSLH